ncbi:hypothetical protein KEM48_013074 [Puccinia striiformis f. sp. tritici PST-130]|nr:hypothetical protein KEM48_013074 [Puccinia striiformis f. sp. tritici PST-130]
MQFWAGSQIRVGEDAARAAREAHGVNGAAPVLVQQGHIPVGQPLGPAGQALEAGPAGIPTREPSRFSSMKMRFIEMWRSIEMKLTKMFDFSWTRRQWNRIWAHDDESVHYHSYVPLPQQHPYGPPTQMCRDRRPGWSRRTRKERQSRSPKPAAEQALLTSAIPRTRLEVINQAALRERITEGTTGRSANTELVPSKTRTVSELTGRSSGRYAEADNNQQLHSRISWKET